MVGVVSVAVGVGRVAVAAVAVVGARLQLLVGEIDAELLERIVLEDLGQA